MTVYYNLNQPVWKVALAFGKSGGAKGVKLFYYTSVYNSLRSIEFWGFLFFHTGLAGLVKFGFAESSWFGDLGFEATAAAQFFMTFFLTFYNKHCFQRFMRLYNHCTDILDAVLLFVFELSVIMQAPELTAHRMLAVKYSLAVVYSYFMGLTGGELTREEWVELERKGFVTKSELQALQSFPGGKPGFILTNWALQVCDHALEREEFHNRDAYYGEQRQQRIEHLHNRLDNQLRALLLSCEFVGDLVALPMPYPYYHLMNFCVVVNFFLLAIVFALLETWFTIPIYAAMLFIFLGFRVVAGQLADPFGQDAVDFPVADFLNYVCHHSMCLMEAFNHQDMEVLWENVQSAAHFSDDNLKMHVDKATLHAVADRKKDGGAQGFQWGQNTPLAKFDRHESVTSHMHALLQPRLIKVKDTFGIGDRVILTSDEVFVTEALKEKKKDWKPANNHLLGKRYEVTAIDNPGGMVTMKPFGDKKKNAKAFTFPLQLISKDVSIDEERVAAFQERAQLARVERFRQTQEKEQLEQILQKHRAEIAKLTRLARSKNIEVDEQEYLLPPTASRSGSKETAAFAAIGTGDGTLAVAMSGIPLDPYEDPNRTPSDTFAYARDRLRKARDVDTQEDWDKAGGMASI